jgi:hypothetical protein
MATVKLIDYEAASLEVRQVYWQWFPGRCR